MDELDLSAFFTTKAQAADFSARLSLIAQAIYHTNFSLENALMEQFGIAKKDAFMTMLRDNNIQSEANSDIITFFTKIQEKITNLPLLTLTIAFEPKPSTLQSLSEWFMLQLKRHVLFDITVDSTIIAGATITYNGKYKDYSVKPIVDRFLAEPTQQVAQPTVPQHMQTNSPTQQAQTPQATQQDGHQSIEHLSLGR